MDNQSKIFNNETIRTVWDKEEEKYFISVVDVVGVITESKDKRKYWNKLKERLKNEGNESVTNCHQLKLKSSDGKYYKNDVVDIEGMLRIIESIPSKNAEVFCTKLYRCFNSHLDNILRYWLANIRNRYKEFNNFADASAKLKMEELKC